MAKCTVFCYTGAMAQYTLPTTEARSRFLSLVKDAGAAYGRYVITYRGKPEAVMMGYEEFEGWLETLELASSASWRKALTQARREDRAGRRVSFEAVVGRRPVRRRRR